MRKLGVLVAVALIASSCGGTDESGPQTRTVRVDYASDEFASALLLYFPLKVTLRPGDSVVFKQTWTGEPHTVTMGTLVDKAFQVFNPLVERFRKGEEVSDEEIEAPAVQEVSEPLPEFFAEGDAVAQNAAQPCYLETGTPPKDPKQPCEQRPQPEFNGRHSFYNSGFIPYGGPRGNEFTIKLAQDIKPGTYTYYCNVHGPPMSGQIEVKGAGSSIPSEDEVNEQAFQEIEEEAGPLRKALERTRKTRRFSQEGITAKGNIAGLFVPKVFGGLNEFIPREINARVGRKVTWSIIGMHTISFDVPPYLPIFTIGKDGTVAFNKKTGEPAGGAPEPPPDPHEEGPPPEEGASADPEAAAQTATPPGDGAQSTGGSPKGTPSPADNSAAESTQEAREPQEIDAGSWDGSGFWSSGTVAGDPYLKYSITFTRPGTYEYACLIHPKMVGTITVK